MASEHSIQTLLRQASKQLETISDSAYLDAELLLAHSINKTKTYLHTWPEKELNDTQLDLFRSLIEKRLTDYPVAYLLGIKAFWTFDLKVSPDVLIPRPETELLVEIALDKIKAIKNPKILDLGTGSGAIALALASERKDAMILATDYSNEALEIAKENAKALQLEQQVSFLQSYWFEHITEKNFDLIVSNPPYIEPEDKHLKETIRFEPQHALIADNQGMSDLEKIITNSHLFMKKYGCLILEHGFDQAKKVESLFRINHYKDSKNHNDLNDIPRISVATIN